MDSIALLKLICNDLRLPRDVFSSSVSLFETVAKGNLGKKYNKDLLAIGALYFHCKSTGKNVTSQHLKGYIPLTSEDLTNVYNDLKISRF